jgi:hypothetical protein
MQYDLENLISRIQLPTLDTPFTVEEIKAALLDMPADHAPGLDGFNGHFMKICWPIIEQDFTRVFSQFCRDNLNQAP